MRELSVKETSRCMVEMVHSNDVDNINCPKCGRHWICGEYSPGDIDCVNFEGEVGNLYEVSDDECDVSVQLLTCKCGHPLVIDARSGNQWITFGHDQIKQCAVVNTK